MMRDSLHLRLGKKYLRTILFLTASVVIGILVWIGWTVWAAFPRERTTIIASTSPLQIRSWDEKRRILTVLSIPEDVRIEGASGVGTLPVSSLGKLEAIDASKRGILAQSLTLALGTPVREGELPFPLRLRFFFATRTIRPDAVRSIDLDTFGVYRFQTLPDGTAVRGFDVNRFDAVIGDAFEVDSIRREELRVRVVNTTEVPGLGSRAARVLSHAGMVVVAVDNESTGQQECTVHAKEDLWFSQSVSFIKDTLRCVLTALDTDERFDVTTRLGKRSAETF